MTRRYSTYNGARRTANYFKKIAVTAVDRRVLRIYNRCDTIRSLFQKTVDIENYQESRKKKQI